jgi:ornithine cyclodeaminase/alanine dehydrogenase-like protein (mu-crystallin family)
VAILLRHEDIVDILTMREAIEAVRAGFQEQATGQAQVPQRITIDSTAGFGWLRVMPAILNGSGVMGYKAMHSTPKVGVRYLVALYDLRTGALLAQMDADWLTQLRTSATAGLGTDLLARADVQEAGLLGSSEQARALLRAMAAVRPFRRVRVFSPTPANREAFAREMSAALGLEVVAVDSAEAAVAGADLVGSAIRPGPQPALHAAWLAPGTHVNAISSVRPEARELEEVVWQRANVVAVDERDHVFDSGDGRAALASGSIRAADTVELRELVSGQHPGRERPEQITLLKTVGFALLDLVLANAIYRKASERGLGEDLGDFPHARA